MLSQVISEEECFEEADKQLQNGSTNSTPHSTSIPLNTRIKDYLPEAKDLHPQHRPNQMQPRVFASEVYMTRLPPVLDEPCQQLQTEWRDAAPKPKIGNREKKSLEQFVMGKDFQLVYSKEVKCAKNNSQATNMTLRLRKLNSTDFNEKMYRQLPTHADGRFKIQSRLAGYGYDRIDSAFESGNIGKAFLKTNSQKCYYLLIDQDINTHGYTNWFFFRVRNQGAGRRKFFILNMAKKTQFYRQNMKISIFSMERWKNQQTKWFKGGENLSFFQTNFCKPNDPSSYFYCLYFEYDFNELEDEVFFSLCQPYTYSRLANLLNEFKLNKKQQDKIKVEISTIGYSLSNNIIPSVQLTTNDQAKKRKIVVLGRQHPNQTAGSFISQYLMKALIKCENAAEKYLMDNFDWVFVPMVNPDGVIYGNSRCNLAGYDLNRHWGQSMIKQFTPETYKIRAFIQNSNQISSTPSCKDLRNEDIRYDKNERNLDKSQVNIELVLDLHGHGKKLNSFLFCCKNQDRYSHRILPLIMSKLEKRFDLLSCTYGLTKDKQSTLRAQLYQMGVKNCFTLENSYYGSTATTIREKQKKKKVQNEDQPYTNEVQGYTEKSYEALADGLLKSLHIYLARQESEKEFLLSEHKICYDTIFQQLIKIIDQLERDQKYFYNEHEALSDSDPEGDILLLDERLRICDNDKNKKLTRKIKDTYTNFKGSRKSNIKNSMRNSTKTEPPAKEAEDSQQEEAEENLSETKLQNKLLATHSTKLTGKKIRQHKFTTMKKNTAIMLKKPEKEYLEQKIMSKDLNASLQVNLSRIPKQKPVTQGCVGKSSQSFDRSRIYTKVKNEINQIYSFTPAEIKQQSEEKERMEESYHRIKGQSLKNMMRESLFFTNSYRNKKCIWVESYSKDRGIKVNQSAKKIMEESDLSIRPSSGAYQWAQEKELIAKSNIESPRKQPSYIQERRYKPSRSSFAQIASQKNYKRFESFVRDKSLKRHNTEPESTVFYHFPIM